MRTLLRLVIAALLLNAAARVGMAYVRYYQFKDDVEQEARFGDKETAASLQQRVLQIAQEHGIQIYSADVVVTKNRKQTTVAALYGEELELVPRLYHREHLFEFEVSVAPVRSPTLDDVK